MPIALEDVSLNYTWVQPMCVVSPDKAGNGVIRLPSICIPDGFHLIIFEAVVFHNVDFIVRRVSGG